MRGAAGEKGQGGSRERLIQAAVQVVARDGLEKASVKAIAAEAGIAPGLMHYHFPDKILAASTARGALPRRSTHP